MPSFPKSPKISYGTGPTVVLFTHTAIGWTTDRDTVGGQSESGAGVIENWIIRKRSFLKFTLRFTEAELASVSTWLDWVMDNGSAGFFTLWPDQAVTGESYVCYLVTPKPNTPYGFKRTSGFTRGLEVDLQVRTVNNTLFDVRL